MKPMAVVQNDRGFCLLKAVPLSGLILILFASLGSAQQVLVDQTATFPPIELTLNTSAPREVVFDAPGPGRVTVKIWVDPYRSCRQVPYQSVTWRWGKGGIPFDHLLAFKSIQNGKTVRNYAEGVTIYHEDTYVTSRGYKEVHAWLNPARILSSSGWTQYRQVIRLVVEYSPGQSAGTPNAPEVKPGPKPVPTASEPVKTPTKSLLITWSTHAGSQTYRDHIGDRFSFICPPNGTLSLRVWGTDTYTYDSSICSAAVHAGLISVDRGGTVTIEMKPGASSYRGSDRNGVSSRSYGAYNASFVFVGKTR